MISGFNFLGGNDSTEMASLPQPLRDIGLVMRPWKSTTRDDVILEGKYTFVRLVNYRNGTSLFNIKIYVKNLKKSYHLAAVIMKGKKAARKFILEMEVPFEGLDDPTRDAIVTFAVAKCQMYILAKLVEDPVTDESQYSEPRKRTYMIEDDDDDEPQSGASTSSHKKSKTVIEETDDEEDDDDSDVEAGKEEFKGDGDRGLFELINSGVVHNLVHQEDFAINQLKRTFTAQEVRIFQWQHNLTCL